MFFKIGEQDKKKMSQEKEELDVQETRQIIGPNSYDDNWHLVGYTSELRDKMIISMHSLTLMPMTQGK